MRSPGFSARKLILTGGWRLGADIEAAQSRSRTSSSCAGAPCLDCASGEAYGTPLAEAAAQAGGAKRAALERDVCARWQEHVTTATAAK
jgi:hypothetical protein